MGEETGLTKDAVHRIWRTFGLQPHRTQNFKLSTDPFFVDKVRDVVGLYLNPPDHAVVCALTRRAKCRLWSAVSRCCRWAWLRGGRHPRLQATRHHNAVCPLDVATGEVPDSVQASSSPSGVFAVPTPYRRERACGSGRSLDRRQLRHHKYASVKKWLASRPRFHLHFTPTYASWLNQVEICSTSSRGEPSGVAHSARSKSSFRGSSATPTNGTPTPILCVDGHGRLDPCQGQTNMSMYFCDGTLALVALDGHEGANFVDGDDRPTERT